MYEKFLYIWFCFLGLLCLVGCGLTNTHAVKSVGENSIYKSSVSVTEPTDVIASNKVDNITYTQKLIENKIGYEPTQEELLEEELRKQEKEKRNTEMRTTFQNQW